MTDFIKISPGAKIDGLNATNNTMVGGKNFINNQGVLQDAILKDNRHINNASNKKRWFEKPSGIIILGIIASLIAALIWALF